MKTQKFIFLLFAFCSPIITDAQPRLLFSIGTGDDDLRANSQVNITIIFFNPDRASIVRDVAAGRSFPDRTTARSEIALPDGVLLSDIQEIRLEFVPDRREHMEDDDWWFTRFVVTYRDARGRTNLYENNSVNKKFEYRETWTTGILPTFSHERIKRISVLDESGRSVPQAEIFLRPHPASRWQLLGRTNSLGELTTTIDIDAGSLILARKRIHEQNYYRSFHSLNSHQDWNYRVYLTNMDIDGEGVVAPNVQNLTSRDITLRIRRTNTLIGCNLVLCAEWDLSPDEIENLKGTLREASAYLYNATDGQFFFEQVTIKDNRDHWDDSDIHVYNTTDYRENVPYPLGAFLGHHVERSYMKMKRTSDSKVYAHEFGHYGLDLADEYEDNTNKHCTASLNDESGTFIANQPKASCMMWWQGSTAKLCSDHSANPHIHGMHRWMVIGDQSCWEHIKGRYNSSGAWQLLSPDDRGSIPGTIRFPTEPVSVTPFLNPLFSVQTSDAAGLLGEHTVRVESLESGEALENVEISIVSPVYTFLGYTNRLGQLPVVGLHSGDEIFALHPSGIGATAVIAAGSAETVLSLNVTTALESLRRTAAGKKDSTSVRPVLANVRFLILPVNKHKSLVSLKFPYSLENQPEVSFLPLGKSVAIPLQMEHVALADSIKYYLPHRKSLLEGTLLIKGKYRNGLEILQTEHISIVTGPSAELYEVIGIHGRVAIHWKTKTKKPKCKTIIFHSDRRYISALPDSVGLIGTPFSVKSLHPQAFAGKTYIEIRLPRGSNGQTVPAVNEKLLKVYRYDSGEGSWLEQSAFQYNFTLKIISGIIRNDGIYALTVLKN